MISTPVVLAGAACGPDACKLELPAQGQPLALLDTVALARASVLGRPRPAIYRVNGGRRLILDGGLAVLWVPRGIFATLVRAYLQSPTCPLPTR